MGKVLDALEKFAVILGYALILKKIIDFTISALRGVDSIKENNSDNDSTGN